MNGNFYTNELLSNIQHAERIAEADAYRMAKQAGHGNATHTPAASLRAFRPLSWFRHLILRLGEAGA
jgi:hypothetical protein